MLSENIASKAFSITSKPSDIASNLLIPLVAAVESAASFAEGIRESGVSAATGDARSKNFTTGADLAVEMFLGMSLRAIDASAGVISEEKPVESTNGAWWVIDPIDGTGNYMSNLPFAVSVAYIDEHGNTVAGVVSCPAEKRTYYAAAGFGSYMKKFDEANFSLGQVELDALDVALKPRSSRKTKLSIPAVCGGQRLFIMDYEKAEAAANRYHTDARGFGNVLFGMPSSPAKTPRMLGCVASVSPLFADVKRLGPTSLDICRVASGEAMAYVGIEAEIWDVAAAFLIVAEAGGDVPFDIDDKSNDVYVVGSCGIKTRVDDILGIVREDDIEPPAVIMSAAAEDEDEEDFVEETDE